jgi:hypothetical protein
MLRYYIYPSGTQADGKFYLNPVTGGFWDMLGRNI